MDAKHRLGRVEQALAGVSGLDFGLARHIAFAVPALSAVQTRSISKHS